MRLADIWREKITCIIHTSTQEEADMLFKAIDSYDHNGTTWASWWNVYKKKTCYRTNLGEVVAYGCIDNYIEDGEKVIEFSDLVATGGYCNGFRGGKTPTPSKPVSITDQLDSLADAWSRLGCTSFQMETDVIVKLLKKSEEKNLKFTFYTVDTSRIDKTNNTKVDTIMTCVHIGDKVGYATCDKEDYDEREGILNAIANLCCDGSFDKAYRKAVKEKKISETLDRTCSYCHKVFDTVEERQEHEAWHIECRKARHQRYLLRKRAKQIAFEEAAQKMAKEMMGEQK